MVRFRQLAFFGLPGLVIFIGCVFAYIGIYKEKRRQKKEMEKERREEMFREIRQMENDRKKRDKER